jgi:hypothetical protein
VNVKKALTELEEVRKQGANAENHEIVRLEYTAVALEMIDNINNLLNLNVTML